MEGSPGVVIEVRPLRGLRLGGWVSWFKGQGARVAGLA